MILTPTIPQTRIFKSKSRFRVVVAGRRFGKTFLSAIELVTRAVKKPKQTLWYVAPTYGSAKEIAWDMLLSFIPEGYLSKINETRLTLTFLNGSIISLKGADKPDNLRGRALDFAVLDEFADMRSNTWQEVIRPSLSDREGDCLFIGSPKGRNHFYDLWTAGVDNKDGWQSFQFTTLEGGNVSAAEIEAARSDLDVRTFSQEYEAAFVNYSGVIYYAFDRSDSVKAIKTDSNEPLHIGMDFNLDPMSAVVAVRRGNDLYIIDEIVIYGSNTDEVVEEINRRYPNRAITVYPDPACRQRKTSAGGRTDLSILQNAGFTVKAKRSHDQVRDRINAVNSRLLSGDGKRHLLIDPACKTTIKSLERQTYKENTGIPDKDSGYDHMNDALGYLIAYLYPIKREMPEYSPTRWT